tara:strand:+ start:140 stop:607 length:468 start_codon:yes stop_codon:yes gene_type:complete
VRYFDDFEVGQVNRFGRYEVEEKEIIDFALRYDRQPFHIDREAAKQSHFGGLVASGWHTCAMMMRMIVDNAIGAGPSATLASPGFDNLRWLEPVRPGDVLSVRSEIVEVTPSRSRPDRGSVRIHNQILRQDDTVVAEVTSIAIILRRAAHTASEI